MTRAVSQASQPVTSETSDYEKHVMGYLVARVRRVYGPRFDATYKTDDAVITAQREWVKTLGNVIPPQYGDQGDKIRAKIAKNTIDRAIDYIKYNAGPGQRCEWPNIGAIVGIVRDFAQPHTFFKAPALEKKITPKEKALENINKLKKMLGG